MLNLIPIPYDCKEYEGFFDLSKELLLESDFELSLVKLARCENGNIKVKFNEELDSEGYILKVTEKEILIYASDEIGAYYALQSIRQLSRYDCGCRKLPCCEINDKPRYFWRGLQLDESRHFFGKEQVKRTLDLMFMMKLNIFHWHLTDDQGWRIEIKKYPRLTEIGSVRPYTHVNGWGSKEILNEEYSGFYTQEDIKEIVDYASQRGIMVVPEIDFPAHSAAAIAAYQWLACRELDRGVPGYFGGIIPEKVEHIRDWNRTICLGNDKAISFVLDVIDEVCELFPAPYFHIGGDEAPTNEWKACPKCQKTMKDNSLNNERELQAWFTNKLLEHLKSKGKRLIGWNEILKGKNIDSTVIGQYWTPKRDPNAENHANSGGSIILSNHQSFYFDMPYAKYPLTNTYNFKPESFGINADGLNSVLGVEGELWTEWIDCRERLELMMNPRMQALAEVAWSPEEKRSWQDFKARLDSFKDILNALDVTYAVDKVSLPENRMKRLHIERLFHNGDVHREDKLNNEYKSKGEK